MEDHVGLHLISDMIFYPGVIEELQKVANPDFRAAVTCIGFTLREGVHDL